MLPTRNLEMESHDEHYDSGTTQGSIIDILNPHPKHVLDHLAPPAMKIINAMSPSSNSLLNILSPDSHKWVETISKRFDTPTVVAALSKNIPLISTKHTVRYGF